MSHSQDFLRGEIICVINGDLLLNDTIVTIVDSNVIYTFKSDRQTELSNGYSRESITFTDSSIINVLYNPFTADSIFSETLASDNYDDVLGEKRDTVISGEPFSYSTTYKKLPSFVGDMTAEVYTTYVYEEGKLVISIPNLSSRNNLFLSENGEYPILVSRTFYNLGENREFNTSTISVVRSKAVSYSYAQIRKLWYDR